jgi:hypothetical protein
MLVEGEVMDKVNKGSEVRIRRGIVVYASFRPDVWSQFLGILTGGGRGEETGGVPQNTESPFPTTQNDSETTG